MSSLSFYKLSKILSCARLLLVDLHLQSSDYEISCHITDLMLLRA